MGSILMLVWRKGCGVTREIKFRAWDVETPQMRYFDLEGITDDYDNWGTLMQFTGLKDKNGVEIYEGDIVKKQRYRNTSETPRRKDGSYTITIGWYNDGVRNGFNLGSGKDIEVIGNIYENPDLVKELV